MLFPLVLGASPPDVCPSSPYVLHTSCAPPRPTTDQTGAVRESLATLRQAQPGPTTPSTTPAKRARHGDDNTSNNPASSLSSAESDIPHEITATAPSPRVPANDSAMVAAAAAAADGEASSAAGRPSARGLSWTNRKREKQQQQAGRAGKGRRKKRGQERGFDHSRWRRRTVAVQLMYEGQNFAGFCSQVLL